MQLSFMLLFHLLCFQIPKLKLRESELAELAVGSLLDQGFFSLQTATLAISKLNWLRLTIAS